MSEYEKMREDDWEQSGRDRDIYQNKERDKELLVHPDDPNYVKPLGWGTYKRYGSDEHHQ